MSTPKKKIYAGNKGLANLGNTCYMNSVLQCLSHLLTFHPLNEKFQAECIVCDDSTMMKAWYEFQRKMWNNNAVIAIAPKGLLHTFQKLCRKSGYIFDNFRQNDAYEFLTIFFDLLHQGIKRKATFYQSSEETNGVSLKAFDTWKRFYEDDFSYIIENFSSQSILVTACPHCEYYTTNHDPFQVISLEIPKDASTIRDCLKNYTKKIKLNRSNEWTCDQCKIKSRADQRTMLWKTPDILIISLKRYDSQLRKNNNPILVDDVLDIEKYTINYASGQRPSTRYSLQGMCVQSGSLGGGHYYANCKNHLDGKWRRYNDTNVNEISPEEALNERGYLYFYKRI